MKNNFATFPFISHTITFFYVRLYSYKYFCSMIHFSYFSQKIYAIPQIVYHHIQRSQPPYNFQQHHPSRYLYASIRSRRLKKKREKEKRKRIMVFQTRRFHVILTVYKVAYSIACRGKWYAEYRFREVERKANTQPNWFTG